MSDIVYLSCAVLSVICAALLYRRFKQDGTRLLLWISLCFAFMALNNIFVCVDLVLLPNIDMNGALWRNALSAMAGSVMLFGLIWELT